MTPNEAQTGQRKKITKLRVLSVTMMICVLASFVSGKIDLHIQLHPQPSLLNILIVDILGPFSMLLTFGFAVLIFNQTFADNPNESWIERFVKKRPQKN